MMTAIVPDITLSHTSLKARKRDGTTGELCSSSYCKRIFFFFFSEARQAHGPGLQSGAIFSEI